MKGTNCNTMRLFSTFLLFFGYQMILGQSTFSVSVTPYLCGEYLFDNAPRNITVYHQGQLVFTAPPEPMQDFKLPNITEGEYKFHFTNSQGKPVVSSLYLSPETREILLCINQADSSNTVSMTRSLRPGDCLFIEYVTSGCFHYEENWLKFYYRKNRLYGEFWVEGKKIRTRSLSASQRAYLAAFEQELRLRANIWGGCTTSDTYTLILNGTTNRVFMDDSCLWSGYSELKKKIFKKK